MRTLLVMTWLAGACLACGAGGAPSTPATATPTGDAGAEPGCPAKADVCPEGCVKIDTECVRSRGIIAPQ